MLEPLQREQFNQILDELGKSLDITESQFKAAVDSYNAVGSWLCKDDSLLKPYAPTIKPQGSFLIGTMIQPYHEDQDLDLDLVCELTGKNINWTQKDLKTIVGEQLKSHKTYESLLDEEGRRCWTLKYRETSIRNDKYHMDILPAIVSNGYNLLLEKSFSATESEGADQLAIRITDKEMDNYSYEKMLENWMQSNPFGYAQWFIGQANLDFMKAFSLNESIKPVPTFQVEKLPLQRVVQILKRHRDMMFKDDSERPISVIITTLAARAYQKETNVFEALINVIDRMAQFIENKYDSEKKEYYKFIGNPVNECENFADRWRDTPAKQRKFYRWLEKARVDIHNAAQQRGQHLIMKSLSESFGQDIVNKTFNSIGDQARLLTEQGKNRFDVKAGLTASGAGIIKPHQFYGSEN